MKSTCKKKRNAQLQAKSTMLIHEHQLIFENALQAKLTMVNLKLGKWSIKHANFEKTRDRVWTLNSAWFENLEIWIFGNL